MNGWIKYLPYALFAGITLAIMYPLYHAGYIFLLDLVFTPHINVAAYLSDSQPSFLPIYILLQAIATLIPSSVLEK
jgi:hypothetical protein